MKAFSSEAGLAAVVVEWLKRDAWDVYQEVNTGQGNPTCDIVAVRGPVLWAIETKLQFGCAVVEQADYWRHRAHFVSVATPWAKGNAVVQRFCEWRGIGWLRVNSEHRIDDGIDPQMFRPASGLRRYLAPEQMSGIAAGSFGGGYHTPFRATCKRVSEYVAKNPGVTLKQLLDGIETHYMSKSSARSGIAYWAERGKIPGVRLDTKRPARLYPTEAP